jgi:hypothetical protein
LWLAVNVKPVLGCSYYVESVSDVLEIHAASIIRVIVCRVGVLLYAYSLYSTRITETAGADAHIDQSNLRWMKHEKLKSRQYWQHDTV